MQLQTYKRLQSDGFWTAKKRRRSIEHGKLSRAYSVVAALSKDFEECTVCPEIKTDLMPEDYAVTRYRVTYSSQLTFFSFTGETDIRLNLKRSRHEMKVNKQRRVTRNDLWLP